MSLNNESKNLVKKVFAAIEEEKREAYMYGYTKGVESMFDRAKNWRDSIVRLKDAPRAMENVPVAPEPCVKDETCKTVKDYFQKTNEELDELKQELMNVAELCNDIGDAKININSMHSYNENSLDSDTRRAIAEEAADVCTAITSLLEALGIGFKERNETQRHVNAHNHERGRN